MIYKSGRTNRQHLNDEEINLIRRRFRENVRTILVAQEVGCSQRVVNKYYAMFAGTPHSVSKIRTQTKNVKRKVELPNRHYKSNFEV